MNRFLFTALLCTIFYSCASTKLTSFVDPEVKDKDYDNILIFFPSLDLDEQQEGEEIIQEEFAEYGIRTERSLNIFSPTREYDDYEIIERLRKNDIDAVLLVEFTDAWSDESYVPQSTTTTTKGKVNVYGNTATYKENSKTYSYGGYYINKPRIKFVSKLIDVDEDLVAWIGTSLTKGNAYAKFGTLISSLGSNIIEDLIKNNLVKSTVK